LDRHTGIQENKHPVLLIEPLQHSYTPANLQ
jgi:hypothetical protein